jgi:F-type H+-transporting ATPase subunit gamma
MANRRVLVKRRDATRNIRKITRTMQLIATARFQAAHKAAVSRRPYTDKLAELTSGIAAAMGGDFEHPLMKVPDEEKRTGVLVLTSNRGLCGAFNTNVLRLAAEEIRKRREGGQEAYVGMVGGKGIAYLKFLGYQMDAEYPDVSDLPTYDEVEPIATELINSFVAGNLDAVEVAYTKFYSAGKQRPVIERVLPLAQIGGEGEEEEDEGPQVEYEFSPNPEELLNELLPATVRLRIFQAFTDSAVSEQVARMVAMTAATEAAGEMIKRLTQEYNRARQSQITLELLDIVGGANALE